MAAATVFGIYAAAAGGAGGLEVIVGWLERLSIVIGFAWAALLATHFLRLPDVAPQTSGSPES